MNQQTEQKAARDASGGIIGWGTRTQDAIGRPVIFGTRHADGSITLSAESYQELVRRCSTNGDAIKLEDARESEARRKMCREGTW